MNDCVRFEIAAAECQLGGVASRQAASYGTRISLYLLISFLICNTFTSRRIVEMRGYREQKYAFMASNNNADARTAYAIYFVVLLTNAGDFFFRTKHAMTK